MIEVFDRLTGYIAGRQKQLPPGSLVCPTTSLYLWLSSSLPRVDDWVLGDSVFSGELLLDLGSVPGRDPNEPRMRLHLVLGKRGKRGKRGKLGWIEGGYLRAVK